jgi:hypothetical protein
MKIILTIESTDKDISMENVKSILSDAVEDIELMFPDEAFLERPNTFNSFLKNICTLEVLS